ncbi:peptidoglycan bridge formation glycyltransferase FemA/FemB family protein [Lactococcus termiticola]|uniref:Aminoacyltransferase FemA n=1 Tax=Lactococcus termiticola TaxID=2169526 RepID=A0A2R5HDT2_9LACT|nr:peptidoglycan bridge formation glycyltransferase FemA/FemB family protein [Lactococcus termiticola]GBG96209.1 peptidoglycan branched peptide synthesis protein [Lactococcus termiticola]
MGLILRNYDFVELSEEEYRNYAKTVKIGSFLQMPEMKALLQPLGWKTYYVGVKEDGLIKLASFLVAKHMTGGMHFEMQYGVITAEKDELAENFFYEHLKYFVKAHHGLELLAIPNNDYQHLDDKGEAITEKDDDFINRLNHLGYKHWDFITGFNDRGESIWHYVKDLSAIADSKKLMKSYSKAGQHSVKKTQQFGIRVRPMQREELSVFKDMTAQTSERRGYDDHDLPYYEHFYDAFGENCDFLLAEINFAQYAKGLEEDISKNEAKIQSLNADIEASDSAKKKKQRDELVKQTASLQKRMDEVAGYVETYGDQAVPLAGALMVYNSAETVYLASGSYENFKNFYAPFAIQHYAMSKTLDLGISSYNFFGIQGKLDGSDGVLRFKENFAGEIVEKMGYFDYVAHPMKQKSLLVLKKLMRRH